MSSAVGGSLAAASSLCRSPPLNPCAIPLKDFLRDPSVCWVRERAHFWHLRDRCELPMVRLESDGKCTHVLSGAVE